MQQNSPLKHMMLLCLAFGLLFFSTNALANIYCDPKIRARYEQDRQNAIMKDIARFESSYGSANSFDSLYCGAQITSAFDNIGSNLVGSFSNSVDGLINSLFQKACKAAVAPLQNLAAQTCIPNFTQNYFDPNFIDKLFNQKQNNKYCNGTQLIQVTPVTSTGGFSGGGSSYPELFW